MRTRREAHQERRAWFRDHGCERGNVVTLVYQSVAHDVYECACGAAFIFVRETRSVREQFRALRAQQAQADLRYIGLSAEEWCRAPFAYDWQACLPWSIFDTQSIVDGATKAHYQTPEGRITFSAWWGARAHYIDTVKVFHRWLDNQELIGLFHDAAKPLLVLPMPLWESPFPEDPHAPKVKTDAYDIVLGPGVPQFDWLR